MAFTGTPVVKRVEDQLARITGISLASGASGTIALDVGLVGEIKLPASLQWKPYAGQDAGDGVVDLEESVQVYPGFVSNPGTTSKIFVVKTGGADPTTFLITVTNGDTSESESGDLELYIRFH